MPERARVALLATGGTIAGGRAEGLAYAAGALPVKALLAAVPGLDALAALQSEQVASVGSQNMTWAVWDVLAARIQALCDAKDADAVVVTHGTDTLEETAYFLNLVLRTEVPVILTGAMLPPDAPDADGPGNLRDAVTVAVEADARGRGVLAVMNGRVYTARDIQKSAASGVDAWYAPGHGVSARVQGAHVHWSHDTRGVHTARSEFAPWRGQALPRVGILYSHADLDAATARALLDTGMKGLVLAGVGSGNTTDAVLSVLTDAARRGVAVVRASRTGSGAVVRNQEVDDDAAGFIAASTLNPQKARVLLALALSRGLSGQGLQACFDRY
ncbi:L-asparaginase [plant metagenome]|uniref:L-asparaginase n=1 Tax=plant metagenome TaxID=1297885 RepID=A0A484R839_9ZZZZ